MTQEQNTATKPQFQQKVCQESRNQRLQGDHRDPWGDRDVQLAVACDNIGNRNQQNDRNTLYDCSQESQNVCAEACQ